MILPFDNIDHRKLAKIFTDTLHHKIVAAIIRAHSINKLDVRNFALDGLQLEDSRYALDLGCGFGFFTSALNGRLIPGANIIGIDLCAMYKTAYIASCKKAGLKGKFFSLTNKSIKSIPENSIDLVICSYALYFFPEIIPEISRILKPSGVFVIITHSKNHLTEIIDFLNKTINSLGMQKPNSLPCQNLIDNFNNVNGYSLLSPWFGWVAEKKYQNTLCFEISDFKDIEKYFRFKQPYYIPDYLDNKNMIFDKMINSLREHLQSGKSFRITKDDTIFVCKVPLSGNEGH